MHLSAEDRFELVVRAEEHREKEQTIAEVHAGKAKVPSAAFQLALPARDYQRKAAQLCYHSGSLLLADSTGAGKAQPLDAKVMTPTGWRAIGSLRVGDGVTDPDGGTAVVTGVFPQGKKEIFRVTTKDRGQTECCAEHLWMTQNSYQRGRGIFRVQSLAKIMEKGLCIPTKYACGSVWNHNQVFLPQHAEVTFVDDAPLPIDSYVLGVLIGDGGLTNRINLTSDDLEVVERCRTRLPPGVDIVSTGQKFGHRIARTARGGPNPMTITLRELGLIGKHSYEKTIPGIYMSASAKDRYELLRGLMDTDGDISCGGRHVTSTFNTTSKVLAEQVRELCFSLGGLASIGKPRQTTYTYKGKKLLGRTSYRVNVRTPECPFFLPRKASRWKTPLIVRPIVNIESVGEKEAVCISVSSRRRLYITDDYIVTHNTVSAIELLSYEDCLPAIVVCPTHLTKQWQREIKRFAPGVTTHITERMRPYPWPGKAPDVVITNWYKIVGWAEQLVKDGRYRTLILDEAHELRHFDTERYRAVSSVRASTDRCLACTATPLYGYGHEMWAVMNVTSPDALGARHEFIREWCGGSDKVDAHGNSKPRVTDPRALGIHLRNAGLMLRRTREEVGRELPPLNKIVQTIDADPERIEEVSAELTSFARTLLSSSSTNLAKMNAGGQLDSRLRQATGLAKAPHVAQFVKMLLEEGERVVLFGWHLAVYAMWMELLADHKPVFYTGEQTAAQKEESKRKFLDRETNLLIMSVRSGVGVDGLQGSCNIVVFGELDWSPAAILQALGRVHRDGQTKPTFAYLLVSEAGSDPIMSDVLRLKTGQLEGVCDPNGAVIEKTTIDPEHVKKLAASFLAKRAKAHAE